MNVVVVTVDVVDVPEVLMVVVAVVDVAVVVRVDVRVLLSEVVGVELCVEVIVLKEQLANVPSTNEPIASFNTWATSQLSTVRVFTIVHPMFPVCSLREYASTASTIATSVALQSSVTKNLRLPITSPHLTVPPPSATIVPLTRTPSVQQAAINSVKTSACLVQSST